MLGGSPIRNSPSSKCEEPLAFFPKGKSESGSCDVAPVFTADWLRTNKTKMDTQFYWLIYAQYKVNPK